MIFKINNIFLIFIPFALAQINETATNGTELNATKSADLEFLNSLPFKDYDAFCSDNGPVRIFQYKYIELGNERDALLFNETTWPNEDILLKAVCLTMPAFFGDEWVNVSTPTCRLGEPFIAGHTVWDNDPTYMCKKGEYVNGVSSEYVNGSRWIKVRCCKSMHLQQVEDYDCFDAPTDTRIMDVLLTRRKHCPIDILSSVTVSRGSDYRISAVGRYCGYEKKDFTPDPFCAVKRRVQFKKVRLLPESSSEQLELIQIPERHDPVIESGQKTPPGGNFDFSCPKFEAVNRIDVEMTESDLVFAFYCSNVTDGIQYDQAVRFIDYQPMPLVEDVSAGCEYRRDEVLCSVKSYVSPQNGQRLYSFGCCQMSNVRAVYNQDEMLKFNTLKPSASNTTGPGASASSKDQFLHRFFIQKMPAENTFETAWSAFQYSALSKPLLQVKSGSSYASCVWTLSLLLLLTTKAFRAATNVY